MVVHTLNHEGPPGKCLELKDGIDDFVEFGFYESTGELFWKAVDMCDSKGRLNHKGCKINFCLAVRCILLHCCYKNNHDVAHSQYWGKAWRKTSWIINALSIEEEARKLRISKAARFVSQQMPRADANTHCAASKGETFPLPLSSIMLLAAHTCSVPNAFYVNACSFSLLLLACSF